MELFVDGIAEAIRLLLSGDRAVVDAASLSLRVSLSAVLIAMLLGTPAGAVLAWTRFRGRKVILSVVNAFMGLPPVVAGLFVVMLLWRRGPLGELEWLYTPEGMIFAQTLIALPIVTGLSATAYQEKGGELRQQLIGLGASWTQVWWLITREARLSLLVMVMAALGRVMAEVGAVMMVGGSIPGQTRVLTTAIVLETRRGNLDSAIALAVVLMLLAMTISGVLTYLQQRGREARR